MKEKKLKIGFVSFTCCEGCQLQLFELGEKFPQLFEEFELIQSRLLLEKSNKKEKKDVLFVEGSITTKKDIKKLMEARKKARFLIAFGACATNGGVNAVRDNLERKFKKRIKLGKKMTRVFSVPEIVKVDYEMRGCPINESECLKVLIQLKHGIKPKYKDFSVCKECKEKELNCLFLEKKTCLGSITQAGCDALCIKELTPCIGCRGLTGEANIPALRKELKEFRLKKEEIIELLNRFNLLKMKKRKK